MENFMILRKIILALFTGLLSTSPCRAMEPEAPKENKADITVPQKLSFKEKAAQVKATIAIFMLNHKKTLIKGTIITTAVILGVIARVAYSHYQRLERDRLERLERDPLEQQRLEQERLEQELLERDPLEQQRLEQELLEQERLEQEKRIKARVEHSIENCCTPTRDKQKNPVLATLCPICLDNDKPVDFLLPCGHRFCCTCIQTHVDPYIESLRRNPGWNLLKQSYFQRRISKCPACRAVLELTEGSDPQLIGTYIGNAKKSNTE
jgi:hypothetical protein